MSWGDVPPQIRDLVEQLTPRQREAIRLKAQGFSGRRMARALGIDAKTARDLLDRAERNLARMLEEKGIELG